MSTCMPACFYPCTNTHAHLHAWMNTSSHTHIYTSMFLKRTALQYLCSSEAPRLFRGPSLPHIHTRDDDARWCCIPFLSPSPLLHCLSITGRTVSSQSVSLEGGGGHKKYSLGLVIHCMCVCLYWKRGRWCRGIMYVCVHVDVSKTKRER